MRFREFFRTRQSAFCLLRKNLNFLGIKKWWRSQQLINSNPCKIWRSQKTTHSSRANSRLKRGSLANKEQHTTQWQTLTSLRVKTSLCTLVLEFWVESASRSIEDTLTSRCCGKVYVTDFQGCMCPQLPPRKLSGTKRSNLLMKDAFCWTCSSSSFPGVHTWWSRKSFRFLSSRLLCRYSASSVCCRKCHLKISF